MNTTCWALPFLQGSFRVDTAIKNKRGDYDIDRSITINSEDTPTDPILPKNAIQEVLESRNFQNSKIKKPCVTADYLSTNLHIDYTVYSKDSFGNYKLAVGKKGSSDEYKEWSESDPEGLIAWIDSTDSYGESYLLKRKQLKRLVRYMKRWRDVTFTEEVKKKIFSIGLTVVIKNEYRPDTWKIELDDDLTMFKNVIDCILSAQYLKQIEVNPDQFRVHVKLPCKPYRDIFQHKNEFGSTSDGSDKNIGTQLKNKLTALQKELKNAMEASDEIKQCEILNTIFGDDFKIPKKSSNSGADSKVFNTAAVFSTAGASGTSQGA